MDTVDAVNPGEWSWTLANQGNQKIGFAASLV